MNVLPSPAFFSELLERDSGSKNERRDFIRGLARLEEKDVSSDDTCAICQETLLAVIAAEEMASVMESPGLAEEDMGVVKLPECGHRFCRKDIATWVYSSHSTCPACRRDFLPESARGGPATNESFTLDEAREFVRLLQLRTAGAHTDADAAHHNPFSEGSSSFGGPGSSTGDQEPDMDQLRRMQDEFMRVFGNEQHQEREEPRESFGMYS